MAAKELQPRTLSGQGERKDGGSKKKGFCPRNTQMDADEAGFFRKAHPRLI